MGGSGQGAPRATHCFSRAISVAPIGQRVTEKGGGLSDCGPRRWRVRDRVEQDEVVDRPSVTDLCDGHPGLGELAGECLSLVTEHIVLPVDDQRRRQVAEVFNGRL